MSGIKMMLEYKNEQNQRTAQVQDMILLINYTCIYFIALQLVLHFLVKSSLLFFLFLFFFLHHYVTLHLLNRVARISYYIVSLDD